MPVFQGSEGAKMRPTAQPTLAASLKGLAPKMAALLAEKTVVSVPSSEAAGIQLLA